MKCDNCQYAVWNKTASGRLHPDKSGQCGYEKLIPLPASTVTYWIQSYVDDKHNMIIQGGYIERGRELKTKCAYYGPIEGGK